MSSEALIRQMLAAREFSVDLGGGRSVKMRRPAAARLARGGDGLDLIVEHSVDWSGFDEAFLLGAGVGGDDKPKFDRALWRVVLEDRTDFILAVTDALKAAIDASDEARGEAAKN